MKKNYVGIILGVIGVALILVAYIVMWNNLGEKTDTLKVQNESLQSEVDRLQDLADHKEQYINDTKTMKEEDEAIIAQFPAEVKAEDEILYADDTEKTLITDITAVAMQGSNVIEVTPPEQTTSEAISADESGAEAESESEPSEEGEVVENTSETVSTPSNLLYESPVTVNLRTSYPVLKEILERVASDTVNKKSINSVAINFSEETGDLEGTVTYNMYSLTGTDKTYQTPSTPGVSIGTTDLFSTQSRVAEAAAKKAKAAVIPSSEE